MNRPFYYDSQFIMDGKIVTVIEDMGEKGVFIADIRGHAVTIEEATFLKNATPLLSFADIYKLYADQYGKSCADWKAYRAAGMVGEYAGFQIAYDELGRLLMLAIRYEGKFSEAQAGFIYNALCDRYSSCYEDVIGQASSMCQMFKDFQKLT